MGSMPFPLHRPRRLRASEPLRRLVRETNLQPSDFILPLFAYEGDAARKEISSMPGHAQLSIEGIVKECEEAAALGIGGVLLFGIPDAQGRARFRRLRR